MLWLLGLPSLLEHRELGLDPLHLSCAGATFLLPLPVRKRAADHRGWCRALGAAEAQHARVPQRELRAQRRVSAREELGTVGGGQPPLQHQHHVPLRINAATARAAAHLRVLGRVQEPLLDAIEFGCAGEDCGASWEVETHRDGLRRNEQAQQPLREQDLDQLAQ